MRLPRQKFLIGSIAGLLVAQRSGELFSRALAQPLLPDATSTSGERVLVLINLQGGNDGLNTVVPYSMPQYYRYRPSIGVPQNDVLRLNNEVGFNPSLRSFKAMFDKQQVAVIQGVGYPKPDHSHFRSQEIWQTADPASYAATGWLGRYLDNANLPAGNLFEAVALSPVLPEVFGSRKFDVPAIDGNLRGYGLASDKRKGGAQAFRSMMSDERMPFTSPYLAKITEIETNAQKGSEELPKLVEGYKTDVQYPATNLGRSLALAAQMVGSKLGTRVIYVTHGSFDTHTYQKATQDRLLQQFSDAVSAFYADLAAHGNDKRVLTMTFSEFGRRVAENASRGTDHGEAAPLFLVGGAVKGGVYGRHPSLDDLDNGDIKFTTDFRSVYATVVERWLGRPAQGIITGNWERIPAIQA
ncbi:MAG: DUF1501 domain-containing protein [Vulcanimicrobiaceae bacterium]